ncbi:MAG: GTP-binding protein [Asgard group archaeon]|nr:GTP-binding protein [Asgard group archaeon]
MNKEVLKRELYYNLMPSVNSNNGNRELTKKSLETEMPLEKKDKKLVKIAIAGDGGVGKTSLCQRAMGHILDDYFSNYKITIGVQFFTHNLKTVCGQNVVLSVWDLAGQPQFHQIIDRFLRGCKGIILAYDSSLINSFFSLYNIWIPLIRANCDEDIPILVVSTKNDLQDYRQVDPDIVKEFMEAKEEHSLNFIGYLETSALSNINVRETFDTLCSNIIGNGIISNETEAKPKKRRYKRK